MASANPFTSEQQARDHQRAFGLGRLLVLGPATAAQGEVTTEAGVQVLTHGSLVERVGAGSVSVTKRSHMS